MVSQTFSESRVPICRLVGSEVNVEQRKHLLLKRNDLVVHRALPRCSAW
jgi:hypothetical protein